jgi:hypothetical protein
VLACVRERVRAEVACGRWGARGVVVGCGASATRRPRCKRIYRMRKCDDAPLYVAPCRAVPIATALDNARGPYDNWVALYVSPIDAPKATSGSRRSAQHERASRMRHMTHLGRAQRRWWRLGMHARRVAQIMAASVCSG